MTPTPEEEREARAWLEREAQGEAVFHAARARRILALLDRPVLPAKPTEEMLNILVSAGVYGPTCAQLIYNALYAHLAKPKTRVVFRVTDDGGSYDFADTVRAIERFSYLVENSRKAVLERLEVPA